MSHPPLGAILYARDGAGARVHSDDEVAHALPLLVFLLQIAPASLPPPVQEAFLRGCAGIGLSGDDAPDAVSAKVAAAYSARPLSPTLRAALDAWARASIADGATPDAEKQKLQAFLGMNATTGVLGGGERPAGTVPAGPLARFAVPAKPPR